MTSIPPAPSIPEPAPGFQKHPDHIVAITQLMPPKRIIVKLGGAVIADTLNALELTETGYPSRYYIPRDDIAMGKLRGVEKTTYCPFKGTARYWDITANGRTVAAAAWGYDAPYAECTDLAGRISFYDGEVEVLVG